MKIKKIHHVAYRCINAKQTVEWYRKYLNMDFVLAIAENQVPSTKAPDPYMHIFLDAGGGNILAFFEIPTYPSMGKDPNTPDWVQHLAFEIESLEEQNEVKAKLESTVDGNNINGLEKALKLTTTVNTNNMNMFNSKRQLHKYKQVQICYLGL